MRYRRLGRTEWMISEIGLAAGALAGADEAMTAAALQTALDARVTVFAVEAGEAGRARAALLARVSGVDRPRLTIVGLAAHDGPDALAAAAEDLAAGGTIEVLALHDPVTAPHLDAAEALREQGAVRALGIATVEEMDSVHAVEALATGRFDVAVVPFAVLDAALLHAARAADAALLVEVASEEQLLAALAQPIAAALLQVAGREALVELVAAAGYATR